MIKSLTLVVVLALCACTKVYVTSPAEVAGETVTLPPLYPSVVVMDSIGGYAKSSMSFYTSHDLEVENEKFVVQTEGDAVAVVSRSLVKNVWHDDPRNIWTFEIILLAKEYGTATVLVKYGEAASRVLVFVNDTRKG